MEEHPPLSDPHPQFVAAKSLMFSASSFYLHFILCRGLVRVSKNLDKKMNLWVLYNCCFIRLQIFVIWDAGIL